jgi:hypothetical protein
VNCVALRPPHATMDPPTQVQQPREPMGPPPAPPSGGGRDGQQPQVFSADTSTAVVAGSAPQRSAVPKKVKKKRLLQSRLDKNHPKRAKTAFMFFSIATRPGVLRDNTEITFTQVGTKIGEMYRALSDEERQKWTDMAEEDRRRYRNQMNSYVPTVLKDSRKFRDPKAPKRPMSAFLRYCSIRRSTLQARHPGQRVGDIAKTLGDEWGRMTEPMKEPFRLEVAQATAEYHRQTAIYRQHAVDQSQDTERETSGQGESTRADADAGSAADTGSSADASADVGSTLKVASAVDGPPQSPSLTVNV